MSALPINPRRNVVLKYPDLAARLTQPPLDYARPDQWNGYVPPETYGNALNLCPRREALVEILAEAQRRDAEGIAPDPIPETPTEEPVPYYLKAAQ